MPIFLNRRPVITSQFPGGECHIRVNTAAISKHTHIFAYLVEPDGIMQLLLTVDAIRRAKRDAHIRLTIPYFPYARQDRVCNPGEAFSVSVMANLVNALQCDQVTVYDPHSDVMPSLIERCQIITQEELITRSPLAQMILQHNLSLVSPDAGAIKKTKAVAKALSEPNRTLEVFQAHKTRELQTGNITALSVEGDVSGKNLIILDDICDGGRTFVELAKVLKEKGAKDIYLYVTHGIFSNGLSYLKPYFKQIYCYHQLKDISDFDSEFLMVLDPQNARIFPKYQEAIV
jgi:ribose-phosphate pyrophosphokinase